MRVICRWILAWCVIWPNGNTVATVGDKPIDLILSDLLFVALPFVCFGIRSPLPDAQAKLATKQTRLYRLLPICSVLCVVYMTSLAGIGVGMSEEWIRLYSAFKLAKPIGLVIIGLMIGSWTDPYEFIDILGKSFGVMLVMTLLTTVTDRVFPWNEWGRYIFTWEIVGYPNSPMSFYAVMVPFILAAGESSRNRYLQVLAWGLVFGGGLMITGSMSRSSTIAYVVAIVFYLAMTGRGLILIGTGAAIALLSIVGIGFFSAIQDTEFYTVLSDRIQTRVNRSTEDDDPSSGRFEIWNLAIELAMEKPTFGFQFESFSRYTAGHYDTPHQQYLEVLYKCGGVGLTLYLTVLASCFLATRRLLLRTQKGTPPWYRLHAANAMLVGVLIGNFTQPNLTYSVTGNMVFLVFGCFCSERAVLAAMYPIESIKVSNVRKSFVPRPRIAA